MSEEGTRSDSLHLKSHWTFTMARMTKGKQPKSLCSRYSISNALTGDSRSDFLWPIKNRGDVPEGTPSRPANIANADKSRFVNQHFSSAQ